VEGEKKKDNREVVISEETLKEADLNLYTISSGLV
jgi:hypothetical protein